MISDLLNDITKLTPGDSRMYTISCKASYILSYFLLCELGVDIAQSEDISSFYCEITTLLYFFHSAYGYENKGDVDNMINKWGNGVSSG